MRKQFRQVLVCVVVALFTLQPMLATASSFTRVIPEGSVTFLENGEESGSVKSEVPLPDGLFMVCEGQCLVHSQGFQVLGQNQTVFAISDAGKTLDLSINQGRVDFAIRPNGRLMTIKTPHDLIQMKEAFFPASTNLIRGYVVVNNNGTEMGMNEGSLRVVTQRGQQLIQQGYSIQLAQVLPEEQKDEEEDTEKAGAILLDESAAGVAAAAREGAEGLGAAKLGLIAAGLGAAGVIVYEIAKDDEAVSPF